MSSYVNDLIKELDEERNVEDQTIEEDEESINRYDITSYGVDFDVDGLVKRINRGDIFIPPFQRNFVWKLPESSRFIESLLLGLPVPGIFLAQEPETGKMLVIDGQQRLLSLSYFFKGIFKPTEGESKQRVFYLSKVHPKYERKTFKDLDTKNRLNLENSVIHATVVKQDSPANDDTSIYHIFERLNSGGKKLSPQEIRTAVYHGNFIEFIHELNMYQPWRKIYGRVSERMKDQELIIRYFAMLDGYNTYEAPMKEFLNKFVKKHRNDENDKIEEYANYFKLCCDLFSTKIEPRPFRRVSAINVAFYEAAMVALTKKIKRDGTPNSNFIKRKYNTLMQDKDFEIFTSQSTGNKASVQNRMKKALEIFLED